MRISDWSSDVCSSDLVEEQLALRLGGGDLDDAPVLEDVLVHLGADPVHREADQAHADFGVEALDRLHQADVAFLDQVAERQAVAVVAARDVHDEAQVRMHQLARSEEHTSELQSLMRNSYAVFCLKKKKTTKKITENIHD